MIVTNEMGRKAVESRQTAASLPRLRREWLNWHLGGFHWIHNDLVDVNLKAIHSCLTCREFRARHWGSPTSLNKPSAAFGLQFSLKRPRAAMLARPSKASAKLPPSKPISALPPIEEVLNP
jgi:hypothetical protein